MKTAEIWQKKSEQSLIPVALDGLACNCEWYVVCFWRHVSHPESATIQAQLSISLRTTQASLFEKKIVFLGKNELELVDSWQGIRAKVEFFILEQEPMLVSI